MDFSERLKYMRKQKHLNIAQAAKGIGVSKTTLASYEQGYSNPKSANIQALADFYGVSIDWLMGYSDGMDFRHFSNHNGVQITKHYYADRNLDMQPGLILYDDSKLFYAPLVKEIREEIDLFATDNIEDFYYIDITFAGLKLNDEAFLYRLHTNNMTPKYSPGDLLLIKKQERAKDGEVVLLTVDNEIKVNLYHYSDHYAFLENINPDYRLEKILITSINIIGKIIWRVGQ